MNARDKKITFTGAFLPHECPDSIKLAKDRGVKQFYSTMKNISPMSECLNQ